MSAATIDIPALGQRLRFSRTTGSDGAEVLHVEIWVDRGGGMSAHVHPALEERFEVISGRPSFLAGRRWRTVEPGATVVVAAGVRHAYRNRGQEPVHMVCHVRPPLSLQEFLEEIAALARAGGLSRRGPTGPGAFVEAATIAHRHREMVVLDVPLLPALLQGPLFAALARVGERRRGRLRATAQ